MIESLILVLAVFAGIYLVWDLAIKPLKAERQDDENN